ncbi:hypothetical protein [Metamycoplasma hominis]|nr:hypothetical protein [Metamycoplasma hominis]
MLISDFERMSKQMKELAKGNLKLKMARMNKKVPIVWHYFLTK